MYLEENICLINDEMEITKAHDLPGILTSLDFRKAFDSLEFSLSPSFDSLEWPSGNRLPSSWN